MSPRSKLIFLLPWIALLFVGCRAIVSGTQQSNNNSAPATAAIDGAPLTLSSSLSRLDKGQRKFDLSGKLTIIATNTVLPRSLNVYHMALRPARSGYYVQNFNRGKNGLWRYAGSYTSDFNTPMFNASLRREDDAFVFEFEWTGLGGGWLDKPDAYNNLDVSVSIADEAGKRHILSNVAVPVEVRILAPRLPK